MIILVKIDAYATNITYPPYGPLYVADSLEKAGYEVQILHNTHLYSLDKDLKKFKKIIEKKDPLFVGCSVNTGRSTTQSAILSESIKNNNDETPIVWGGVHPTVLPGQCVSENYIDFVVIGEGEETTVELAQSIEGTRDINSVRGVAYTQNNHPVVNPARPKIEELDKYGPAWHLIDIRRYLNKYQEYGADSKRMISYLTSRGCPYRCAFCYLAVDDDRRMRYHSTERVISEIEQLKNDYDVDAIWFNDDNFFANTKRAFNIIHSIDLPWFGEVRIDKLVNETFLNKLRESQCICVMSGAESGSDRILQYINKGITVAQTEMATKMMAKYRIPATYSFVIGFPTETWDGIIQTVRFVHKLEEYYSDTPELFHSRIGFYLPYPGAPLYDIAIEYGFQPPNKTRDWGTLERYEMGLDLPWVPEIEKAKTLVNYVMRAGRARVYPRLDLKILYMLYKYRLEKENFSFPIEIELYSFIAKKLARILKK